jgi:putative membrane protein
MRHSFSLALGAAIVASALSADAQTPKSSPPKSQTPATRSTETAEPKTAMTADHHFVMNVAEAGMAEVELGRLAADKASNVQVKEFGRRMVTDHGKAGDELKPLAASKNITLPTSVNAKDSATKDRLSKLSGAAFDRAYMAEMVKGHQAASAEFHKEATTGHDAEIKGWAARTVTTVDDHLKMARDIQKEVAGSKPTQ